MQQVPELRTQFFRKSLAATLSPLAYPQPQQPPPALSFRSKFTRSLLTMFKRKISTERRIFFPWEGRGGLRRFLALGRVGPVIVLSTIVSFIWWVAERERDAAGERSTVVAITSLRHPVERYLLEHEGDCPEKLEDVLAYSNLEMVPRDGWGRRLRLVCPAEQKELDYVLMSDGPDGLPGGLDRIEF